MWFPLCVHRIKQIILLVATIDISITVNYTNLCFNGLCFQLVYMHFECVVCPKSALSH